MPTTNEPIVAALETTSTPISLTPTDRLNDDVSSNGGGSVGGISGSVAGGQNNCREARNLAEKQRRDKLNASIQELATMVPHVAEATRRLDKTAVLRFAAHGLRLQHVFGKSTTLRQQRRRCGKDKSYCHQQQQPFHELTDTLLGLLDSFFITLTCHGQIVLVSSSVEQLLGHCQSDLYGQNIFQIVHPDDQATLRQQLIPREMDTLFQWNARQRRKRRRRPPSSSSQQQQHQQQQHEDTVEDDIDIDEEEEEEDYDYVDHNKVNHETTAACLDDIDQRLRADRRCFTVRLARAGLRTEAQRQYECVKIDGCFRRSDCSNTAGSYPIVSQLIRRSKHTQQCDINNSSDACNDERDGDGDHQQRKQLPLPLQHDVITQAAVHGISGNDIVLVAMARIVRPAKVISRLIDPNQLEYRTRHLIDGRIVDCDQRIGLVAGYMKDEVRNLSPFSFIHLDDVRWVIVALRQMYDCNSNYGESCYRLMSRNGHFIYLQTKGFLEIDRSTNKVHSFICVNTLLSEEEGRRRVQAMKDKFSVIIKTKIPSNVDRMQDVPASQYPQQLERIVLYLIENLQHSSGNGERNNQNSSSIDVANNYSERYGNMMRAVDNNNDGHQSLALVPPETASVKSSITNSINVVNITASRNLPHFQQSGGSVILDVDGVGSAVGCDTSSLSPSICSVSPLSSVTDQSGEESSDMITTLPSRTIMSDNNSPKIERPSVLKLNPMPSARSNQSNGISILKRMHSSVPTRTTTSDPNECSMVDSQAKRTPTKKRPSDLVVMRSFDSVTDSH